jgi:hypothetical protein
VLSCDDYLLVAQTAHSLLRVVPGSLFGFDGHLRQLLLIHVVLQSLLVDLFRLTCRTGFLVGLVLTEDFTGDQTCLAIQLLARVNQFEVVPVAGLACKLDVLVQGACLLPRLVVSDQRVIEPHRVVTTLRRLSRFEMNLI